MKKINKNKKKYKIRMFSQIFFVKILYIMHCHKHKFTQSLNRYYLNLLNMRI